MGRGRMRWDGVTAERYGRWVLSVVGCESCFKLVTVDDYLISKRANALDEGLLRDFAGAAEMVEVHLSER